MLYIYRRASSTSARELAVALGGKRFRGRVRPIQEVLKRGDVVICWGETLEPIAGVKVLNGGPIHNKMADAVKLRAAGIATIEVSQNKPVEQPKDDKAVKDLWGEVVEQAEDFIEIPYARGNPVFVQGIRDFSVLVKRLNDEIVKPLPPAAQWLPRMFNHKGGSDLLQPPVQPEFWVKKESLQNEIRIHSFDGKSIRAGKKMPRAGVPQHEWIRSYDAGWSIVYDGFESTEQQRKLANGAVKALGLTFGAVDLGQKPDGSWLVLEVNRAAGLEGGTIEAYKGAIQKWVEKQ